ncbi:THAP domain-containing protein 6-like [Centruroides sculpturatus]|uniref:THAP domain-containing protein 6-like n=1 Tax=Centruroides sculpturatus TaxID=218467 RepID=UPI000C6CEFCB|nr:THAP domain-containing protein 6-like [Centruroides sculpturatus]
MVYCCVPFCTSRSGKTNVNKVSFHWFPNNFETKRKWIVAISRIGEDGSLWTPRGTSAICGLHFKSDDFDPLSIKKQLKPEAVPTIFPRHPKLKKRLQNNRTKRKCRVKISENKKKKA